MAEMREQIASLTATNAQLKASLVSMDGVVAQLRTERSETGWRP